MYADFETVLRPLEKTRKRKRNQSNEKLEDEKSQVFSEIEIDEDDDCQYLESNEEIPKEALDHHVMGAFSLTCTAPDALQNLFPPITYCGPDADDEFVRALVNYRQKIEILYENEFNKIMAPLTREEEEEYKNTSQCHICEEEITCQLSMPEWTDTKASKVFTTQDENCLETDLLGPKVR